MRYEQIDFLSDADKDAFKKQEEDTKEKERNKLVKPDDGLDFNCENCSDQGCAQCGWGKKNSF